MNDAGMYITTPIYYVNADPHIGHAHTSVMADVLKRVAQMAGHEVFMTTGTDEHGQKNQEAADKSGLGTQPYLDQQSARFRTAFEELDVGFDMWVRTTDEHHKQAVRAVLSRLHAEGVLVKKRYEGLYCTGCEMFKRDVDLDEQGRCNDHLTTPELTSEENYFLRIGVYQDWLRDKIETQPEWIQPDKYRHAVLRMLDEPLDDLCISRPKSRVSLGVELPFDPDFVCYVWFDALINYLSNLGWPEDEDRVARWWPSAHHLMAKDIIKTHCIYWPCMLEALGVAPPKAYLVHGYWVGEGNVKMSKTIGNVVTPRAVIEELGPDSLRFYMAKNMRTGDAPISNELVRRCHNGELGNNLGNLYSRVVKLAARVFDGAIPEHGALAPANQGLLDEILAIFAKVERTVSLETPPALAQAVLDAASLANQHFFDAAPWKLAKQPDAAAALADVMVTSLEALRIIFIAAHPVLPATSDRALRNMGCEAVRPTGSAWVLEARGLVPGASLGEDTLLFARV